MCCSDAVEPEVVIDEPAATIVVDPTPAAVAESVPIEAATEPEPDIVIAPTVVAEPTPGPVAEARVDEGVEGSEDVPQSPPITGAGVEAARASSGSKPAKKVVTLHKGLLTKLGESTGSAPTT